MAITNVYTVYVSPARLQVCVKLRYKSYTFTKPYTPTGKKQRRNKARINKNYHTTTTMTATTIMLLCLVVIFTSSASSSNVDPIIKIRRFGFDRDHKTFSHEVIAPWARPFKPGYCDSWEWNTVPRYREARLKLCRELTGSKLWFHRFVSVISFPVLSTGNREQIKLTQE